MLIKPKSIYDIFNSLAYRKNKGSEIIKNKKHKKVAIRG